MNPFTILAPPLGWLLAQFYSVIPNYGVAIIILTVLVNLVLFPLTLKQTRSMKAMQELQPEIKKLQKEYKDNRQELNQQLMALYQERGVNPAAGCLPLILQMPVWFALFSVLRTGVERSDADEVIGLNTDYIPAGSNLADAILEGNTNFLSMDLSQSPQAVFAESIVDALPYIALVLIVAGTGYWQSRQTMARRPANTSSDPKQRQQQQQAQLIGKIMGPMLGVFSWFWPTGLVVYFASSNIFRVGQQAVILRLDGDGQDDGENGAKRKSDAPDGGSSDETGKRTGPSPHASKKKKGRRR